MIKQNFVQFISERKIILKLTQFDFDVLNFVISVKNVQVEEAQILEVAQKVLECAALVSGLSMYFSCILPNLSLIFILLNLY